MAFAVAALAYAVVAARRAFQPAAGSSNRDEIVLACTRCAAESTVDAKQFNELTPDESSGARRCPQCGAPGAYVASLRCPKCKRAIPHTRERFGSAFVCPFCQAPLTPGTTPQPP